MSWFTGFTPTSWYAHADPSRLRTADGESVSLLDFCQSVTPPCYLNPFVWGGNAHTIMTAFWKQHPPINYSRRLFESDSLLYPGSFSVDFVHDEAITDEDKLKIAKDKHLPPRTTFFTDPELADQGSDDSKPMLVVMHGISGGSHEDYVRHTIQELRQSNPDWEACVINARGCARADVTTRFFFNARATWDIRQLIKWLRQKYPNRPLFGIGFSLGANIITNYAGEEGVDCPLKAVVAVSSPWNLELSNHGLQTTYMGRELYSRLMCSALKKFALRHQNKVLETPGITLKAIKEAKYLHEFDRYLTASHTSVIQCPTFGYPNEECYYRDASSIDTVLAIRVPFFAVQADDDPIVCKQAQPTLEIPQNPWTVMASTASGGHIGWFELGGGRWYIRPVIGFLQKFAETIDMSAGRKVPSESSMVDEKDGLQFDPLRRRLNVPL